MAITGVYSIKVNFQGDVNSGQNYESTPSTTSPGVTTLTPLALGDNTIALLASGIGLLLLPPAGNTTGMTIKGNAGDTGIPIHLTNPTLIANAGTTSVIITAAAAIATFRTIQI